VYVVLLLAAVAVLAGVVVVAMGRGGEIATFARDLPDARFRLRTPSDVAALGLPLALFGYQERTTRDALASVAQMIADRDAEINRLRAELAATRQAAESPASTVGEAASALLRSRPEPASLAGTPAGDAVADAGEPAPRS
jgi:hypothetical protein